MNSFEPRRIQIQEFLRMRKHPIPVKQLRDRLEAMGQGCSIRTLYNDIKAVNDTGMGRFSILLENGHVSYVAEERVESDTMSPDEMAITLASWRHTDLASTDVVASSIRRMQDKLVRSLERTLGRPVELWRFRSNPNRVRRLDSDVYGATLSATLLRKRVRFDYHSRGSDRVSKREVSPQAVFKSGAGLYLYGVLHGGTRDGTPATFSLDRMRSVSVTTVTADSLDQESVDREIGTSFGCFVGQCEEWARLRFTPHAARWVRDELWHPHQRLTETADGGVELLVPFARPEELERAVLEFGPECVVLGPDDLRDRIGRQAAAMAALYAAQPAPAGAPSALAA